MRRVLRWMAALAIAVVVAFLALHWLPERLAVNGPWVGLGTLGDLILGRIPAETDEGLTRLKAAAGFGVTRHAADLPGVRMLRLRSGATRSGSRGP